MVGDREESAGWPVEAPERRVGRWSIW